jgi:type IV pilus biogenesis protein CpaD/CtpE
MFNLFSLKEIGQTLIPRQVSSLVMSLAVLSLFVLTGCLQGPASVPVVEEAAPAVAPMAVTEEETASDSAFLAANPELAIAQRYAVLVKWNRLHHPGR